MASLNRVPPDVIHEILINLPDTADLGATIHASKTFYKVFRAHPQLITDTILNRVVGAGLLQVARLAFYALHPARIHIPQVDNLPTEDAFRSTGWSLNRDMMSAINARTDVAQTLQDWYSLRRKDRTSLQSQLDAQELARFRRALYRYWLLFDAAMHNGFIRQGEHANHQHLDATVTLSMNIAGITALLNPLSNQELFEIMDISAFLRDLEDWDLCAAGNIAPRQVRWFRFTPSDPMSLAEMLREHGTNSFTSMRYKYLANDPAVTATQSILRKRGVSEERILDPNAHPDAIVRTVCGQDDQCSRCGVVYGVNLLGSTNMHLLSGIVAARERLRLLTFIDDLEFKEMVGYFGGIANIEPVPDEIVVYDMMKLDGADADLEHWSRDGWYCVECIKHLFRQRFMLWWRSMKHQGDLKPDVRDEASLL
ncbi:hypothetical protein BD413DRAFT_614436 [Trametes elegans]|nr:hypothetical protein BD413DRAFT_614436 [Trametes elegans]